MKKNALQKTCDCGSRHFNVYYYPNNKLDYIECAVCGENIDWE